MGTLTRSDGPISRKPIVAAIGDFEDMPGGGSSEILEMIASGAECDKTIEALALLIEKIAPETRCAVLAIDSDAAALSNICAPTLARLCKAHLLQAPVGPPMLDSDWRTTIRQSEDFLTALHPKDRDRTMNAIEESICKDALYDIEYRVIHPNGTMRWISATGPRGDQSLSVRGTKKIISWSKCRIPGSASTLKSYLKSLKRLNREIRRR
jgi:hypothetical protein